MTVPTPLILVAGFLGAGKTTFLRALLPLLESRGLKPFVIINDYANARVDASSLAGAGRTVTPINGNCICCDALIDLVNTLLTIPEESGTVVLIEANGTSDSTTLLEHLLIRPELSQRFSPLVQVTVVDVARWQKRFWHNALERLQVETASHVLLTRVEECDASRIAAVRAGIQGLSPKVRWVETGAFAAEVEEFSRMCGAAHMEPYDHALEDAGNGLHEHAHHDAHHPSHGFVGLEIDLPDPMSAEHLHGWVRGLPPDCLRIKGVVRFAQMPDRWFQFQRGDEFGSTATLHELPQKPAVPACAVLIGVKLDGASIRKALRQITGTDS